MSTTPSAPNATPAAKGDESSKLAAFLAYIIRGRRRPGEVVVVSHSDLFYWWPVWLVGFVMALVTLFHNVHIGFIHGNPELVRIDGKVKYTVVDKPQGQEVKWEERENGLAIITDDKRPEPFPMGKRGGSDRYLWPLTHSSKTPGIIFAITLLLVIVITNVHLRGLWSVVAIIVIVLGSIIFALAGWWENILASVGQMAIHINMGAYLFIATILLIIWLINVLLFDRQHYVTVTPGQVQLHLAIGEGEIVYDTTQMVFQRERNDIFRHWILGFGSGDLIIRPPGKDPIHLPNVLFVGSKVDAIEEMLREKSVVPEGTR